MNHATPALSSVLLVDDTPANLVALGAVLKPLGASIVEARVGRGGARARRSEESFAVVLLDVQMPGMDGFEVARRLRETDGGREAAHHLPHGDSPRRGLRAQGVRRRARPTTSPSRSTPTSCVRG